MINELGKVCMIDANDSTTDLDFYVDKPFHNLAYDHYCDTKVARRIGEYFVKQIQKLQEVRNVFLS
ncbi:unnamed protein product [Onchocerca flexuosa]|uniref:SGNH domain-containing protein n=1 Tax=Onchocerca flexuosa TaxID=387005 RepID=A0A183HRI1_9BILA|nr:unnamed protein product [Onchocerca flexuosa]